MNTQNFDSLWEEYGMGMPNFDTRDEMNAWIDYQLQRKKGKSHDEAMAYALENAEKYAPTAAFLAVMKAQEPTEQEMQRARDLQRTATGAGYLRGKN